MLEANGTFWILIAILFSIALIMSCIGFKKFVYFLSVGYGLAVLGIGVALVVITILRPSFLNITANSWVNYILGVLLILYGIRLSSFLLFREIKSASYRKTLEKVASNDEKKMPVFVKATIWISVGILYVMETYPIAYRIGGSFIADGLGLIAPLVGASIAFIGLLMETIADLQKNHIKKVEPTSFARTGLYKYVRCPNYLGEIIFWTGIFVSGVDIFSTSWVAWLISILGYVLIVYVMISGAKRLEIRQSQNYGERPEYQEYVSKTPIISRLIPIKSLKNWNWIK